MYSIVETRMCLTLYPYTQETGEANRFAPHEMLTWSRVWHLVFASCRRLTAVELLLCCFSTYIRLCVRPQPAQFTVPMLDRCFVHAAALEASCTVVDR